MAKKTPELTKEQKVRQQLIDSIRALTNYKVYTLGQIEKTLNIPQNTLSGMLNGSRNMASKWERLLTEFIKALPKEDKSINIKIDLTEQEKERMAAAVEPVLPKLVAAPTTKTVMIPKIAADRKFPPSGLTKSQLQRWYRENSQTLK